MCKRKLFIFLLKTFHECRYIDLKMHLAYRIRRNVFSRWCRIDNYRQKLMSIKRPCDSLITLCFWMVHSVVNNSNLSSVELKKKLIFFSKFYFKRRFNTGTSPQTFHNIFPGPWFVDNLSKCGAYCTMWHDGSSTHWTPSVLRAGFTNLG